MSQERNWFCAQLGAREHYAIPRALHAYGALDGLMTDYWAGMQTQLLARHAPSKNLVTRALGVDTTVATELGEHDTLVGDVYLLCSDGLTDMADDREIETMLKAFSSNLQRCATELVQMANEHGGRDNVSVILAGIRESFPAPRMIGH